MTMLKITKSIIMMIAVAMFISCQDMEDAEEQQIRDKYISELTTLYPGATHIEWSANGVYGVANFSYGGSKTKVWFADNVSSKWQMIETEITYQSLPQAIQVAFMASEYKGFKVEEVEKLVRHGVQPIYVLEIESSTQEVDLYYSETGVLVKSIVDMNDNENHQSMLPTTQIPTVVVQFVIQRYPNSRVLEYEYERGFWVAEIVHDGREKDVYFDSKDSWSYTKWDILRSELPPTVVSTIESQYGGYTIDDIEYVESVDNVWYKVEMEQANRELSIRVTPDGSILK